MIWCTCRTKREGFRHLAGDLWVCAECDKPTSMVFRKLTNMRVPYKTSAILSAEGKSDGRYILRFALEDGSISERVEFNTYPRKVDMNAGESLLLRTWELLDSKVEVIMAPQQGPGDNELEAAARERAKYEARGIAETLAILMQPFLTEADEVVRHAVKRHKAKQAGEVYDTPGLSEHLWDPNTNWDGSPRTPVATKKPGAVTTRKRLGSKPVPKQLSDAEKESIKGALAAGMFTPEQLAATFNVPVETVQSLSAG